MEMIPNLKFWIELPELCNDGIIYFYCAVTGKGERRPVFCVPAAAAVCMLLAPPVWTEQPCPFHTTVTDPHSPPSQQTSRLMRTRPIGRQTGRQRGSMRRRTAGTRRRPSAPGKRRRRRNGSKRRERRKRRRPAAKVLRSVPTAAALSPCCAAPRSCWVGRAAQDRDTGRGAV